MRRAIGPDVTLAIDGNGKWDLPTCLRFCRAAEAFDVYWFEEPLWYDDVKGHAELARATRIPVALGEQLYTQDAFAEFFHQRAVHWVQPDVTRMGGLTEVLAGVRDRALVSPAGRAARRRHEPGARAPELRASGLCGARIHPVDQGLLHRSGRSVVDGFFRLPQQPGAGTTPTPQAWERFRRPAALTTMATTEADEFGRPAGGWRLRLYRRDLRVGHTGRAAVRPGHRGGHPGQRRGGDGRQRAGLARAATRRASTSLEWFFTLLFTVEYIARLAERGPAAALRAQLLRHRRPDRGAADLPGAVPARAARADRRADPAAAAHLPDFPAHRIRRRVPDHWARR